MIKYKENINGVKVSGQMDTRNVVPLHNGMLLSREKERSSDVLHVDGP